MEKGLVHIYSGNGKGKTTAAMGLALRCAGRGYKVGVTSFMKNFDSGEYFAKVPYTVFKFDGIYGFWNDFSETEKNKAGDAAKNHLKNVFDIAIDENYDMLILDEVIVAVNLSCLDEKYVAELIKNKPEGLEVVLTGANPPHGLVEIADYVSEIIPIKHPYEKGISARKGIEY